MVEEDLWKTCNLKVVITLGALAAGPVRMGSRAQHFAPMGAHLVYIVPTWRQSPNIEAKSKLLNLKGPLKVWFLWDLDYVYAINIGTCGASWV